jgi:hypothetical protein
MSGIFEADVHFSKIETRIAVTLRKKRGFFVRKVSAVRVSVSVCAHIPLVTSKRPDIWRKLDAIPRHDVLA